MARLSRTVPKHKCPPPRWPALNWALTCLSYLTYGVLPVFLPAFFFHLATKFTNCSLVSVIKRQLQIFPPLFIWALHAVVCLNLSRILHSHSDVGAPCLCSCMLIRTVPKSTSSNRARADKAWHAWRSDVLRHGYYLIIWLLESFVAVCHENCS